MFKIISVGWNCRDWIAQTIASVVTQKREDWELMVVYDGGDTGEETINRWAAQRPSIKVQINSEQKYAPRNQYEGILAMAPGPDDIIVFLDLDGDRFAHPNVLQHLDDCYAHGPLLTYGSYKPVPDPGTSAPARPFPREVIDSGSYRQYLRAGGLCCFNHLRTMKGKVFNAIPPEYFKWPDGRWYDAGTDYLFMLAGLELAGRQHMFINETLLLYNHANPYADYLRTPAVTSQCINDILLREPLKPLSIDT
jgi:glycosyltransferase involved in cell wall biosynthesis